MTRHPFENPESMKKIYISMYIFVTMLAILFAFPVGLTAADSGKPVTRTEKDVDAILTKMGSGAIARTNVINDIQKMGKAAVPRLLFHATHESITQKQGISFGTANESFSRETKVPNPKRNMALYLLKFAWSPEAVSPLTNILKSNADQDARLLAFAALDKNAWDSLKPVLPSLVNDRNPEIAGIALEKLEMLSPDPGRIIAAIARPEMWKSLELYLPRYYTVELTPKTITMLKTGKTSDGKAAAIASLISQNANSEEIRKHIAGLMKSYDPAIREISAEYLSWHGTDAEIPSLDESITREDDIYALASMNTAKTSIKRRSSIKSATNESAVSVPTNFKEAIKLIKSTGNSTGIRKSFEFLKTSEVFEPLFVKGRKEDGSFLEQRKDRMELTGLVFGIPGFCSVENGKIVEKKVPGADSIVPPIRNYLDQTSKSFGAKIGQSSAGAGELVRICDIAGLKKTYLTVVSIGNGIVKSAEYNQSWGYAVIIEHAGNDGRKFCSLYAHLSPFMHVKKDDIVSAGEKIGSIGRHFTWENGGFGAHLQFGIYNDAFDSTLPLQVSYIPAEEFAKGQHKWVNPQSFIQKKMKKY